MWCKRGCKFGPDETKKVSGVVLDLLGQLGYVFSLLNILYSFHKFRGFLTNAQTYPIAHQKAEPHSRNAPTFRR